MTDWRTIWLCARVNFSKWAVTPRIYTLAAVVAAYSIWLYSWISDYASAVGIHVTPWVFPFLFTMPVVFTIYGGLTALLYCDAPFVDTHTPFLIVRTSRLNWMMGQLLYIVLSGFVYTSFFALTSMAALVPNLQFSAGWGMVLKTLAYDPSSPDRYGITAFLEVGGPMMSMFSSIEAMLISFGLFWLVTVFIGVLIFCFNVVIGRFSGLVAAGVFTGIGYFSVYVGKISYGNIIYYLSPLNWISMSYLDWGYTGKMPTPTYAISILIGAILLMSIVSIFVFCKKDLRIQERRT
ncbi:hypothetical protein [Paenibacillus sp. L3-i20]|uniref:hypothetical protein n=1 Tax=Paenibacillus sp. L3-i20 TaxID=2905833 RepID=UPI001EDE12F5|nr:hypothetical protein [Paenibacillus sp. L3-i20]GKU77281.1 hypothetical protein L3i20_v216780 [Paenibacillus sp. L3-i20]